MNTESKLGEFHWNELHTTDVVKAKKFYSSLLGWTFSEHRMGTVKYTMIKLAGKAIGGMMTIRDDSPTPYWTSYIIVEDMDVTIKQVSNLGGEVLVPSTTVPNMGVFAVISDPTGASIALWQSLDDK